MDTASAKAILELVANLGYSVSVRAHGHGLEVRATSDSGRFIVRGTSLYDLVCELAVQVGMDLADG